MTEMVTSLRLFVLSVVVCSAASSGLVLGIAMVAAPGSRQGSLLRAADGTIVGSQLLSQGFTRPEYFWPRPSACDFNASAAAGSNLSPANQRITTRAEGIIARLAPVDDRRVPADLVLTSGSGLDPHITRSAALFQSRRVAAARNLSLYRLTALIDEHLDSPVLAILGLEPLVNVLELNLALDAQSKGSSSESNRRLP